MQAVGTGELIIGDFIFRSVDLTGTITYCLPDGKVTDITELLAVFTDLHPSAHTIIGLPNLTLILFKTFFYHGLRYCP